MAKTKMDRLAEFMASGLGAEFEAFWRAYPRKVGKFDAMLSYQNARKVATAKDILAGVSGYMAHKPEYADWCHPKTWLNQGRWMDEYDAEPSPKAKPQLVVNFRTRLEPLP